MLDPNHPHTPNVFAAARQLDMIFECCKQITLAEQAQRQFLLEVIRPAFAALRWLNENRFGRSLELAAMIDEFEQKTEKLAKLRASYDTFSTNEIGLWCPVCDDRATISRTRDNIPHCRNCLKIIRPVLARLQSKDGFGTDAI